MARLKNICPVHPYKYWLTYQIALISADIVHICFLLFVKSDFTYFMTPLITIIFFPFSLLIDDGTEEDLLAAEGIEDEEVYDDYDLAHDDLESNLLAMSNSLQIQNLNIGGSNDVVECKNKDDIEIDDSNDDDQHSGSSSGDCFGSTGLFTAM